MIRVKLIYLVFLVALALFYVLYIDTFALIMLLCALIVPLLLGILLLILRCSSNAVLTCDNDNCAAGESIPVTISVRNRSPLAFPQAQATVILQHSFGTGKEKLRLRFPLQASNLTKITFYVHAEYCGAMEITLKKVSVLDYLHLFHTNLTIRQKKCSVLVLPKCVPLPITSGSEPVFFPDGDAFGDHAGDDPSQIFGFHEYSAGDQVSRIHWKLSTKMDKLYVKEFSTPIHKSVLLLLNYSSPAKESMQVRIQKAETFLTLFYSIVCRMLDEQLSPVIVWYDGQKQTLMQYLPESTGQLTEVFRSLYETISSMELDVQELMDAVSEERYSSLTCITNQLPHTLLEIVDRRLTANQKTLLHICSQEEDPEQIAAEVEQTAVIRVHSGRLQEDIEQLFI